MNFRILIRCLLLMAIAGSFAVQPINIQAKTKEKKGEEQVDPEKSGEEKGPEILRVPSGPFENLRNKVSNVDFYSSNYGILFLNVQAGSAGGIYPRNSGNRYLFGGGIWFGAQKFVLDNPDDKNGPKSLKKLSVISYNPNSGASWMVPGEVTQPYTDSRLDQSQDAVNKYRIYFSSDYNSFTGAPNDPIDVQNGGPNWPIWDADPNEVFYRDRYLGRYVSDLNKRNRDANPKGPGIVSGEDIVTIFKDTDLTRYEIGKGRAQRDGYPLGIEVDQRIYSWGFGQYQNFIFIRYSIVNKSSDTLQNCWMAPALDTDIGEAPNDHTKTAIPEKSEDSLNLGVQWSEVEATPYGYMGADFLESPATDVDGFLRKDKKYYEQDEQLGLKTLRNWIIDIDPKTPEERYDFMAGRVRDGDNGPGDKRFLMATGPFNMLPGDTARIVVAILIAPSKSANPTGEWEDLDSLIKLDLFAQKVYDENFIAPRPPEQANANWRPLNNGVELSWDETSERSLDFVEKGLDFTGYIIQRSRKAAGSVIQYDSVVGYNIGWKTIGRFDLPPLPSNITRLVAARQNSISLLESWWRLPMLTDTVPGLPAVELVSRKCADTIKREGLADTIIYSRNCTDTVFHFAFDPFDDENNDSAVFAGTRWTTDGAWGERFKNKAIRDIVRNAITEIMDSVTNGRSFIDVGDDNRDGQIAANSVDLISNEKLINNIDYYYQILAFDQGDATTGSPRKVNSAIEGKNEVRARPEAPPAGLPATPEIISQSGLGGIHNFRVVVYDEERMGQLFGGDTLEFEFQPFHLWDPGLNRLFRPLWYTSEVIVRSYKLGELNRFVVPYNFDFADRANNIIRNVDSSYISRFVYSRVPSGDTTRVDSVYYDARSVMAAYSNTFVTQPGSFVFNTNGVTKSTFGIVFDYTGQMFGDSLQFGKFQPDSSQLLARGTAFEPFQVIDGPGGGSPNTNLVDGRVIYGNDQNSFVLNRSIPSIGQVKLEIEFLPGGTEDLVWQKNGNTYRASVPYLNVQVKNIASFDREVIGEDGQIQKEPVQYNYQFPVDNQLKLNVDTATNITLANEEATIRLVETGKFGILTYDWTDIASVSPTDRRKPSTRAQGYRRPDTRPTGTPNRYYLGTHTATIEGTGETIDVSFTHRLIANGSIVVLDYAGMGSVSAAIRRPEQTVPDPAPSQDFQAGDKLIVNFTGGALGLPEPGGKVVVAVPDPKPAAGQFTDDLLDAVRVVPNPYLVDHLGQRTSSEKLIYFTRLPEECTIQIFTVAGELVQTIEHNAAKNTDGRIAVNAWDLVTRGGRQAETQLFVARITTPDGAETVKKFSIIVGGFHLFTE